MVDGLQRMLWIEEWLAHELLPSAAERFPFVERHLAETKQHALTVRTILTMLGEPHDPQPSAAVPALARELDDVLDLLAHVEHLELAAYTSLRTRAYGLEEEEIALRLTEVIEQEQHALELVERQSSLTNATIPTPAITTR